MFTTRHYEAIADILFQKLNTGSLNLKQHSELVYDIAIYMAKDNERFNQKLFWRRATNMDDARIIYWIQNITAERKGKK